MYPVGFSPQDPGKGGLNGASLSLSDLVSALPKNSGEVAVGNGFVQYFPGLTTKPAPANALGSDPDNIKGRNTNQIVVDSAGNTVFQNPAPGTVGNVGLAYLTGPTHFGLNMALQKQIHVREGMTMTLRGDAVNILNKPVWGDPNLDINSANFGRITTATGARTITINARIDFEPIIRRHSDETHSVWYFRSKFCSRVGRSDLGPSFICRGIRSGQTDHAHRHGDESGMDESTRLFLH
jgi:hypothetical protein